VRLVPTCLAAHEFPPERRGATRTTSTIIARDPPARRRGKAGRVLRRVRRARRLHRASRASASARRDALGMIPRLHADELSDTDGARSPRRSARVRRSPDAHLRRRHRALARSGHGREPAPRDELLPDVRPLRSRRDG
jgi:hypothetical protein